MAEIKITRGEFPTYFGGFGFHNSEAMLYPLIEKEHFDQKICKCYRELSPGFMRTFGGYSDWTREHMDAFAHKGSIHPGEVFTYHISWRWVLPPLIGITVAPIFSAP